VQSQIQGLNLSGISADSIIVRKLPWARDFTQGRISYPGIVISPYGVETMSLAEGTNLRDDVGYPVIVSILAADNQDQVNNLGTYLLWREKLARYFRNQPLATVNEVYTCRIEPQPIVLPAAFQDLVFVSAMCLRFISREQRGLE
jgi:hypothetical protein